MPKTRSGKIMRRILRKIVEGELENLGDLSTCNHFNIITYYNYNKVADPSIVESIILGRLWN